MSEHQNEKNVLEVEIDVLKYDELCSNGTLKEHLELKGFDLERHLSYHTDPKTGNVLFIQ